MAEGLLEQRIQKMTEFTLICNWNYSLMDLGRQAVSTRKGNNTFLSQSLIYNHRRGPGSITLYLYPAFAKLSLAQPSLVLPVISFQKPPYSPQALRLAEYPASSNMWKV